MATSVDFQTLFDSSPNLYMLLDGQLKYVAANAAYLTSTASKLEDLLGRYVLDAFPNDPDDPNNPSAVRLRQSLERVLATGQSDVLALIPYRVPTIKDGHRELTERYWSATHTPICDESGQTVYILQHAVDISTLNRQEAERQGLLQGERAARAAAEAAEQQQRFLAESIPQQVWTALPNGNLDFVNRRALDYFGASEGEVIDSGWVGVVHPDDVPAAVERWGHSLRTGDEYEVEFRLKRADGAYRWHLGRALALRDAEGRIVKWFGTNTDMDELKRARDELQKRTEFDQQLIGIVSHDLRNPLNAIGMATALLLRRGQLDDQHVKIVTRIMSSSERAVRLIRDFLDFTHARVSGRIPVEPEPANIREIARHVFEEVHLMHHARPATLEHTGEESGIWDADRLAQLVGNLLSNAFQHGSAEGVVRLTTYGSGTDVVIEVHNHGSPIPAGDVAKLFEPFHRGTHASVHSGRSVGLGLYISKQIVAAHGGTIAVESTLEDGTRFTVRLPREPVVARETHAAPATLVIS